MKPLTLTELARADGMVWIKAELFADTDPDAVYDAYIIHDIPPGTSS